MTLKKLLFIFIAGAMITSTLPQLASADLGISPPYVRNPGLAPGSRMEQTIFITRSNPEEALQATIEFNVPGADAWLSIDRGNKFLLPKGEEKIPITIGIDVPMQASFGRYRGNIRLVTKSLEAAEGGQVALAFGAIIDIDINVVAMKIVNYNVRGVRVYDAEEDYKLFFLNPPSVIAFAMQIENRGNVKSAPTKVLLSIYEQDGKTLIKTIETTKIPQVKAFTTDWVSARMPAYLKKGSYPAFYKIYRDDKVIQEGETHVSINPKGTVDGYVGPTFFELSLQDQLKLGGVAVIISAIVFFLIFGVVKYVKGNQDDAPRKVKKIRKIREITEKKEKPKKVVKRIVKKVVKKKVKKDTK